MAFISGNNLGGKDVDYYDNPNYDPKNEGKSKGDKLLRKAAAEQDYADSIRQGYDAGAIDEYEILMEAENEEAVAKGFSDKKVQETVSYFRAKERERLNPGGPGGKIVNEKFSKPSGTIEDKVAKLGISYDPTDPDMFYDEYERVQPQAGTLNTGDNRVFDTSRQIGSRTFAESTMEFKKGNPLANTVAGVNQELQAIKARTRDAAMEFRGRVYDFIDEVTQNLNDDFAYQSVEWDNFGAKPGGNMSTPPSYSYIENKYFPNSADKAKARNTILKMIDSTDNEAPLNSLRGVAEEMAAVKDPGLRDFGVGTSKLNKYGASNANTLKNLESGIKEFQAWKAKKGVPRIIRLIKNLP